MSCRFICKANYAAYVKKIMPVCTKQSSRMDALLTPYMLINFMVFCAYIENLA
jgi:hypothetical protein